MAQTGIYTAIKLRAHRGPPLKLFKHHGTMVPRDIRGAVSWAPIMPGGVRHSDIRCKILILHLQKKWSHVYCDQLSLILVYFPSASRLALFMSYLLLFFQRFHCTARRKIDFCYLPNSIWFFFSLRNFIFVLEINMKFPVWFQNKIVNTIIFRSMQKKMIIFFFSEFLWWIFCPIDDASKKIINWNFFLVSHSIRFNRHKNLINSVLCCVSFKIKFNS